MKVTTLLAIALILWLPYSPITSAANINVTYNIKTDIARTPVSKYIYGTNSTGNSDYTVVRSGGNRLTAYNWENNWSNAGSDWYFENDQYMSSSTTPGKAITDFRDSCVTNKQDSIVTLQMAGYVSDSVFGEVNLITESAPSRFFKQVVFAKGAPFCSPPGSPNTSDAYVYMDEFVNFMVSKYGHAGEPNGVKFYCMDNEPDIWSDGSGGATHPEVHPAHPTCAEYKDKSVAISLAVKNVDPNAQMLGPVSYGFGGYLTFQDAPDWAAPLSTGYGWFLDYYLDKMEANSVVAGKRLLDALDVHWYPEAQDGAGNRITDNSINTAAMYSTRMQTPRSLWDYDYHEISWIETWYSQWLPILPPLQNSINTYYPDTNLSISEYAYGGEDHYSGGIATADVLGIFGKYGVYIATYWGSGTYVDAAIKIYRNYDGNHSTFGDMDVFASMSNKVDSSIYASVSTADANALHMIVINKNSSNAINGTFNITSPQNFTSGRVWRFDSSSPAVTKTAAITDISNNTFKYTIPPLTVCHIVLQTETPMTITKCKVTAGKTQYHNNADYNDMKDTFTASGTISLPADCNDINSVEVNIISVTDGNVVYTETLTDFNPALVNSKAKYTHSAKVSKGQAGKITSLILDFRKRTFAIKANNIDLTGLACPVQLGFTLGSYQVSGSADETVVNGSKQLIPARLMRLYKDTLIVTNAKVKNIAKPSSDSLSIKGDIAVADMNLDTNEPNLVTEEVVITLSDINDTNTQTFTILPGSFKASQKGHLYKCSKINPVIAPVEDVNTLVTANIDLDNCTFTVSIIKSDLKVTSGDGKFGLSFAAFNQTDNL
jgi:Glycoside hydrolase family 44